MLMISQTTITEIIAPTPFKVGLAVVFTVVGHLYVLESTARQLTSENVSLVSDFWWSNFLQALPYLETENVFLKFITFFILSYAVVWVFALIFRTLDQLQVLAVKAMRRNT